MLDINSTQGGNFYINLLRQLPGLIVVMDKQSQFIYSNNYTANLFGYSNEDKMLGITAHGMKCPAVECANEFISQDRLILETGNDLTILDIHKYAYGGPKILLTKKAPYRENGEIVGTICHCTEIHSATLSQTCAALIKSDQNFYSKNSQYERSYKIGSRLQFKKLTERELDCVFYLLRGYTMKQTAKSLNISPRTVETHLEQTRIKLNCNNKSDIIEYCLAEGLLNYIPSNIVSQNISNII